MITWKTGQNIVFLTWYDFLCLSYFDVHFINIFCQKSKSSLTIKRKHFRSIIQGMVIQLQLNINHSILTLTVDSWPPFLTPPSPAYTGAWIASIFITMTCWSTVWPIFTSWATYGKKKIKTNNKNKNKIKNKKKCNYGVIFQCSSATLGGTAHLTNFVVVYAFFSKITTHWWQVRYVSYR